MAFSPTTSSGPKRFFLKRSLTIACALTTAVSAAGFMGALRLLEPLAAQSRIEVQIGQFLRNHRAPLRSYDDAIEIATANDDYWRDDSEDEAAERLSMRSKITSNEARERLAELKRDPQRLLAHSKRKGLPVNVIHGADVLLLEERIRVEKSIPKVRFVESLVSEKPDGTIAITPQNQETLRSSEITRGLITPERSSFDILISTMNWGSQITLMLIWLATFTVTGVMIGWSFTHPDSMAKVVTFSLSAAAASVFVLWFWDLIHAPSQARTFTPNTLLLWHGFMAGTGGLFVFSVLCVSLLVLRNLVFGGRTNQEEGILVANKEPTSPCPKCGEPLRESATLCPTVGCAFSKPVPIKAPSGPLPGSESWWRQRSKFFRLWAVMSCLWIVGAFLFVILVPDDSWFEDLDNGRGGWQFFMVFMPPALSGAGYFLYQKLVK